MSKKECTIKFSNKETLTTSMVSWDNAMSVLRTLFRVSDDEEIVSIDIYNYGIQANFCNKQIKK